jgi:hypothetical protein
VRGPVIAVVALAVAACAPAPPSPPAPLAADARPGATIEITGLLSRKGTAEASSWAVTDPAGRSWLLIDTPPALDARLGSLQGGQVTIRVESLGRLVLDQARLLAIVRPAP